MIVPMLLVLAMAVPSAEGTPFHADRPFVQDSSEQIPLAPEVRDAKLLKVRMDRNGRILVLPDKGLLQIHNGTLRPDHQDRPLADMQIKDIAIREDQFVYLTDEYVLSNASTGEIMIAHQVPNAYLLVPGEDCSFLIAGDGQTVLVDRDRVIRKWDTGRIRMTHAAFDVRRQRCWLTGSGLFHELSPERVSFRHYEFASLNCLEFPRDCRTFLVGTNHGLTRIDPNSWEPVGDILWKLPCADIRSIRTVGDLVWCLTPKGAFVIHPDSRIDYYASRRWLLDDEVVDLWPGPAGSVLVLSQRGLNIIRFEQTTLAKKAEHFDRLTRQRHIRFGFNSAFEMSKPGDISTGTLVDQDNDGLWTAMYLAGELFRYAVTKSDDALRNCYESFEAMERLSTITGLPGFPARSFERAGYQVADKSRWHTTPDGQWAWKGTTSSDEIVGHFFVYAIIAEIAPDEAWRKRAVALIDAIMDHIVRNNWYLLDLDGQPTQWGRWHPEYVNQLPRQVGDRRLNSVEIIAFLQTAYQFTGKELYRQKAYELMDKHGYLDNIMIPVKELGQVAGIDLTTEWNHSDDELAFLSYWNLYRYAFTPELRERYRQAIRDHWEIERPEKNPLWNFIYAMTGAADFDLDESVWTLQQFPLDTISWTVRNSHRKDLDFLPANFREQSTKAVLPPDERPMSKYNGNAFQLDGGDGGREEFSGDIYLLPYWMGRYLGVIR